MIIKCFINRIFITSDYSIIVLKYTDYSNPVLHFNFLNFFTILKGAGIRLWSLKNLFNLKFYTKIY